MFFRRDRLRPVDEGTFWLSDTPDEPVSNTWGSLYPRVANHARFLDVDGSSFTLLTSHFDHEENAHGDDVRRRSAALVVERLHAVDGPVVFAGDCNEPAGDGAAWQVFVDAGYRDAWLDAGDPADRTRRTTTGRRRWTRGSASTGCSPAGCARWDRVVIDHDGPETWAASDHFPVVATIRV